MEHKHMEPLSLQAIGFCGIDDSISQELIILLSEKYPLVEWGILFRPDLEGTPRYASWKWTKELCELEQQRAQKSAEQAANPLRLAAHLCGSRCQEILDGDIIFVRELRRLGFRRVQINATKANNVTVDLERLAALSQNIRASIIAEPTIEWILQYNTETKRLLDGFLSDPLPNMSILYDASCGLGIQMKDFPVPERADIRHGYAGGINPNNFREILSRIQSVCVGKSVWVDMESSLRMKVLEETGSVKDSFSIEKCMACIKILGQYLKSDK
jgi:hypothetical protein